MATVWLAGCYIRRLCVCFHKLSFSGLTAVLKAFRHYYSGGGEDTRGGEEGAGEQWSGRQAELFVASQAALLAKDEERACDPRQLRTRVQNALASNPDLAEAVRNGCLLEKMTHHINKVVGREKSIIIPKQFKRNTLLINKLKWLKVILKKLNWFGVKS